MIVGLPNTNYVIFVYLNSAETLDYKLSGLGRHVPTSIERCVKERDGARDKSFT